MTALQVSGVTARLGGKRVLDNVALGCAKPELIGLLGPNGAGKTTLLRVIAGLLAPEAGTVLLDGRDVSLMKERDRARLMAYLPQERVVAWPLTCRDVVMLGRHPHRGMIAAPARRDHDIVDEAMAALDIARFAQRPVSTLSGGEKARVLIARALAQEPALLLADEPGSGLDPAHQIAVMEHFAAIARAGRPVIVTMHDLSSAARWCDRIVLLDKGRVRADGPPAQSLAAELLDSVYGIEAETVTAGGKPAIVPLRLSARANDRGEE